MCICLCKWMYHICVGHRKWSRHTENLSDFRLHTPKQKYRNPKLNFEQICYGISSPLPQNHKTFANSHGEWTQDNPENCLCSQHSCVNMHVPRTTSFTVFIYSCICIGRHINTLHILPSTVNLCYTRTTFMHNAHMYISIYTFTQFDSDTRTLFCNKHSMGQCATPCGRMAFWPVVVVIHYTTTRHTRGTHMPQKSSCVFIGGISCACVRHKYVCVCRAGGWCHTTP